MLAKLHVEAGRWCANADLLRAEWFTLDRAVALERLTALQVRAVEVMTVLLDRLRPAAARLHPGAWAVQDAVVRALEIHEVLHYGPWPASVRVGRNPLERALPRAIREQRPLRPHLAPVVEVRCPGKLDEIAYPVQ